MIITCWGEDPNQRWEIAAICELFSKLSLQEVQKVKSGNSISPDVGDFVEAVPRHQDGRATTHQQQRIPSATLISLSVSTSSRVGDTEADQ